MARSIFKIRDQIERLQKEAAAIQQEAIGRIRKDIAQLGLTPEQLFGTELPRQVAKAQAAAKAAVVKFADEAGNTWGGMGKRPDWLRQALAAGKALEDFLVGKPAKSAKAAKAASAAKAPKAVKAVTSKRPTKAAPVKKAAPKKPAPKAAATAPAVKAPAKKVSKPAPKAAASKTPAPKNAVGKKAATKKVAAKKAGLGKPKSQPAAAQGTAS